MEKYTPLEPIGKGSFGEIWKVQRKSDSKVLVWKVLNYSFMSEQEKAQIMTETSILEELNHPCIVKYYDTVTDSSQIYIVMEYCQGGDLSQLIKKYKENREYIPEDIIWKYFYQMVLGVHLCHAGKSRILHRDLKPRNIFIDESNNVKIGDFGLARIMGENSLYAQTCVGTPFYMSPEQVSASFYDEKSDIWSLGCILYELAAQKPPFQGTNYLQIAVKIKEESFERIPLRYSEDMWNLVTQLLNKNPEERPSTQSLINFPQVSVRIHEKESRDSLISLQVLESKIKKRFEEALRVKQELKLREDRIKQKEKSLENEGSSLEEITFRILSRIYQKS